MSDPLAEIAQRTPLRCRVFGHRWEQRVVAGPWRFYCRRCHQVEGYCGMGTEADDA